MDDEKLFELTMDICDPVRHLLSSEAYEVWFEAVYDRLRREFDANVPAT